MEQAAALPCFVGAHWFQWADEPVLGRMDGENYNIGFVDVTNRPYAELAGAARETHDRLAAVHAGKTPPFPRGRALQSTGRRNRLGIKFGGDPDAVYRAFRA